MLMDVALMDIKITPYDCYQHVNNSVGGAVRLCWPERGAWLICRMQVLKNERYKLRHQAGTPKRNTFESTKRFHIEIKQTLHN